MRYRVLLSLDLDLDSESRIGANKLRSRSPEDHRENRDSESALRSSLSQKLSTASGTYYMTRLLLYVLIVKALNTVWKNSGNLVRPFHQFQLINSSNQPL